MSDADLERCCQLLYNDGTKAMCHLYDCIRNPEYFNGKPFMYMDAFMYLKKHTILLKASKETGVVETEDGVTERVSRPMGVKRAKLENEGKKKASSIDDFSSVAGSIARLEKTVSEKQQTKREVELRRIHLEKERFRWQMAEKMFGAGSSAPPEERALAERLMRKRVLASLMEMSNEPVAQSTESAGASGVADVQTPPAASGQSADVDSFSVGGVASMARRNGHCLQLAGVTAGVDAGDKGEQVERGEQGEGHARTEE